MAQLKSWIAASVQSALSWYRGAETNRTNDGWLPLPASADAAIEEQHELRTSRERDLQRNDPTWIAASEALAGHVIYTGIGISAEAILGHYVSTSADTELTPEDDEFNDESDALFAEWNEREIDADGELSGAEMQRIALYELASAGEVLFVESMNPDPNRISALQYQLIEAAQLNEWISEWKGNRVIRGIEYDSRMRKVAYHILSDHPHDWATFSTAESERVPAERVIHYFCPGRPRQRRGVSLFAAAAQPARDRDVLVGNVLTSAAIQSLFTLIHYTDTPGPSMPGMTSDDLNRQQVRLGRGVVRKVGANDRFEGFESKQPGPNLESFIRLLHQLQSMSYRMSYLRMSRDYSATNYSSARAAHLDDDRTFKPLQVNFGNRVVKRQYGRFLDLSAGLGRFASITPRTYLSDKRRWQRSTLALPGRHQIDELKETTAARERMDGCLTTLQEETSRLGGATWKQRLRQRSRELRYAQTLKPPVPLGAGSSPLAHALVMQPSDETPHNQDSSQDTEDADAT